MKQKLTGLILLLLLALAACSNPVEKLQETATERLAEQIVERVTGIDDVSINQEDGSFSMSVNDGEGSTYDVSMNQVANDLDALTAFDFTIALPDGLTNGGIQRTDVDGVELLVNATFDMGTVTQAQLYEVVGESATAQGFVYLDESNSGLTGPDAEAEVIFAIYQHPDGYQFSLLGDDSSIIMSLLKVEGDSSLETADTVPTFLDGSMSLDGSTYQVNGPIEVTLVIHTPLDGSAWLGIVPSEIPHGFESDGESSYLTYSYVSYADENGKIILYAPDTPGSYDVRLYNSDWDGVEVASETITVTE